MIGKGLKARLGIRYGMSSKAIEVALKSAGFEMLARMPEEQQDALPALPEWATDDAVAHFCWQVQFMLGRVGADKPELPAHVPAVVPRKRRTKPNLARGFDYFCWLENEKIRTRVEARKGMMKYKGKNRGAMFRLAGSELWKKLKHWEKWVYVAQAYARPGRVRVGDGRFGVDAPEPAEEEVAPPLADEEDEPLLADEVNLPPLPPPEFDPDHETEAEGMDELAHPMVTPKKKRKVDAHAGVVFMEVVQELWTDDNTLEKEKRVLRNILARAAAKDHVVKQQLKKPFGQIFSIVFEFQ